jgi:hypothetical protein
VRTVNLSALLSAKADRYARNQGAFILRDGFNYTGSGAATWEWFRGLANSFVSVLYLTEKGQVRSMVGRQGVYKSEQDGEVQGIGHSMASRDGLTLSFHTNAHGDKVNTGSGKGYRTLRADRILVVNVNGQQFVTDTGRALIDLALSL